MNTNTIYCSLISVHVVKAPCLFIPDINILFQSPLCYKLEATMASPNSNSQNKLHAFADYAIAHDDMEAFDHILAGALTNAANNCNASKPSLPESSISARVHEKNQNAKLKKKQPGQDRPPSPQRISISLTQEEIEEDLFAMTGKRPLRCKKKRTKKEKNDFEVMKPLSYLFSFIFH